MFALGVEARILVVEDDAIVAADVEASLTSLGYDVVALAVDADEAVTFAETCDPDLVLMDIRLPGDRDGIEAGTAIRDAFDIPVVYLTAHSDPGTLARAKASGSWGYLVKPFEPGGLRAAIEMALSRHQAQTLLRESEARFEATLDALSDAVLVTDSHGRITFANPAAEFLLALPADALVWSPVEDVVHLVDERGNSLPNPVLTALRDAGPVYLTGRVSLRLPGGRIHPVRGAVSIMEGPGSSPAGTVLALADSMAEREEQRGLLEREARYRSLYRGDLWATFVMDPDGVVRECNPAFAGLLGIGSVEGAQERTLREFLPVPLEWEYLAALLRSAGSVLPHERTLRRLDGGTLHVIMTLEADQEGGGTIGRMVDITERKHLEAHIADARRMESVGRLAGGVTHIVEDLLKRVRGTAAALLSRPDVAATAHAEVRELLEATEGVADVVGRLSALGKGDSARVRAVPLARLLTDILPAIEAEAGAGVITALDLTRGADTVRLDPGRLAQAVLALVANAREAMPDGGTLTVATFPWHADEMGSPPLGGRDPESYVIVAVTDTGEGMDESTRRSALDPFFTTRVGHAGLGLPTVEGIVREAGGWISIESSPGAGTRVALALPRAGSAPVSG